MSSSIKPSGTFSQDVRALAKAPDKKANGPMGEQVSELAHNKKMGKVEQPISVINKKLLNASILESSLKFDETIADKPQSLLLKSALEGINDSLKAMGIYRTVEDGYDSGLDFSPEATAERIVSFSTQFFTAYQDQHPEMDEKEALTKFVDVISGGIDQGFGEAKDVLGGLKVLEGDVADNIDKTYGLVQEGLQAFIDAFSEPEEEQPVL
ncbi:MAG: hypothetical protein ACJAT7_000295 [Psychromonas sp.]|jgi:hypothetical protein|uniref:DUF5610 domain-containing protein n=1 Tax=Psychromonas sp. TaxID=1884585 RepID=UPI0039E7270B